MDVEDQRPPAGGHALVGVQLCSLGAFCTVILAVDLAGVLIALTQYNPKVNEFHLLLIVLDGTMVTFLAITAALRGLTCGNKLAEAWWEMGWTAVICLAVLILYGGTSFSAFCMGLAPQDATALHPIISSSVLVGGVGRLLHVRRWCYQVILAVTVLCALVAAVLSVCAAFPAQPGATRWGEFAAVLGLSAIFYADFLQRSELAQITDKRAQTSLSVTAPRDPEPCHISILPVLPEVSNGVDASPVAGHRVEAEPSYQRVPSSNSGAAIVELPQPEPPPEIPAAVAPAAEAADSSEPAPRETTATGGPPRRAIRDRSSQNRVSSNPSLGNSGHKAPLAQAQRPARSKDAQAPDASSEQEVPGEASLTMQHVRSQGSSAGAGIMVAQRSSGERSVHSSGARSSGARSGGARSSGARSSGAGRESGRALSDSSAFSSYALSEDSVDSERAAWITTSTQTEDSYQPKRRMVDANTVTTLVWGDQGFRCTACAKPPLLPGPMPNPALARPPRGRPMRAGSRSRSPSVSSVTSSRSQSPMARAPSQGRRTVTTADLEKEDYSGLWVLQSPDPATVAEWSHWVFIRDRVGVDARGQRLTLSSENGSWTLWKGALSRAGPVLHREGTCCKRMTYLLAPPAPIPAAVSQMAAKLGPQPSD